jgi:hypothetical protein
MAHAFLIPNSSVSTKRTVSRFMPTSSALVLTVHLRSDRTRSLTRAELSPVGVADGRALRCFSSTTVLLSENISCQRQAPALDITPPPESCCRFPRVMVAFSPNLTHQKVAYCYAVFRASICTTRFSNTSVQVEHLLHTETVQTHCKWELRKDQDQRLCALAGCSIARRKSVSLLCCQTAYFVVGHGENSKAPRCISNVFLSRCM